MARAPTQLRLEPALLAALEQWAADELRSTDDQLELVLRAALRRAGRATTDKKAHPYR